MKDFSYITNLHPSAIEDLYKQFTRDPKSIDQEYRKFFEGFDFATAQSHSTNGHAAAVTTSTSVSVDGSNMAKEFGVYQLIRAYRKRAHLIADTNPIRKRKDRKANLSLENFGLSEADLNTSFQASRALTIGEGATLAQIIEHLNKVYATHVGVEYTYINDKAKYDFIEREFELTMASELPLEKKKRILKKLNEGVIFEEFLHKKFIGQKRFSLEGGESTIAGLDAIINQAANDGVQEAVIGMAHRGRLNILANILHKTYDQIFNEFEGNISADTTMGSGDVKYHLGFRSNVKTVSGAEINLQLMPNPSHLEAVNPVVIGFARAKADILYKSDYDKILPILIHGDASIAGQGIVYEVLQMSDLAGYYTGGTIHFVINNQIGFTTDFEDARSADYCTSLAAMVQAPVFHVNGDDPEAVVRVCELAVKYRQEFNSDVFIDMVCYRRHGHNEGDDPKFTQPSLYALIEKHKNPREIYNNYLMSKGDVDAALATEMEKLFWKDLQDRLDEVKQNKIPYVHQAPEIAWREMIRATEADIIENKVDTAISQEKLSEYFHAMMKLPDDFKPLAKVKKLLQEKVKTFSEKNEIDWATGELLAYASLLAEGHDVRMSGQDVKRGTFSHRHLCIRDEETNKEYNRLSEISKDQGKMRIYNSLLSEYAVLGFEYGYSMANPNALTIWEAQFGDFVNGAQTMIDQFISSAEVKWNRMNGLVMLLPHGYEGQGPEHSSARLERFLQGCAELNMIVTNITTSANFFHALRRQLKFNFRKPMINFSPKANLRNPRSNSKVEQFTSGHFQEVIADDFIVNPSTVKRVLICSGKVYFDLSDYQIKENRQDVAIIRLEQIYPLPVKQLKEALSKYPSAQYVWVQEEPRNMGAAGFIKMNMPDDIKLSILSRTASAATATGYAKLHTMEQNALIEAAFKL